MSSKVYLFTASWCTSCSALKQLIKQLPDEYQQMITEVSLDTDVQKSVQFRVRTVPSLIMVDEKENELSRLKTTNINLPQLQQWFAQ